MATISVRACRGAEHNRPGGQRAAEGVGRQRGAPQGDAGHKQEPVRPRWGFSPITTDNLWEACQSCHPLCLGRPFGLPEPALGVQMTSGEACCAGDVITALGNKDASHIPYRNSKLVGAPLTPCKVCLSELCFMPCDLH